MQISETEKNTAVPNDRDALESARHADAEVEIRILGTTDLHANVMSYDYYVDRSTFEGGLDRLSGAIGAFRAEARNCFLFDNGDFLQGNPLGDHVARAGKAGSLHPVIAAMNEVGYDAATLGNHEFNYGLEFLLEALEGAQFPVVSANVLKQGTGAGKEEPLLAPWLILERNVTDRKGHKHPLRVGVIGVAPPQLVIWDNRALRGQVATRPIVDTIRRQVPLMKAAGADIVIALCHTGIAKAGSAGARENAAIEVGLIPGIDAILTGHQHLTFPSSDFSRIPGVEADTGTLNGKPAVMAGAYGSHLGIIDLDLSRDNEHGEWRVTGHRVEVQPMSRRETKGHVTPLYEPDQEILDAARDDHERTLVRIRNSVGHTRTALHSYFALVANDPSVRIVTQAQRWFAQRALAHRTEAALPILSAAAPFKTGGRGGPGYYTHVRAGRIAMRNVADLYLHPNSLTVLRITGAELRAWLERSASIFNTLKAGGQDQHLINPDIPGYTFDVIDGLNYEIDLSQAPGHAPDGTRISKRACRIQGLRYAGEPVADDREFLLVTNSYRAAGSGNFPLLPADRVILETSVTNRDALAEYIAVHKTIHPDTKHGWSFRRMPSTTAVFETGPGARDYAQSLTTPTIEELDLTPTGFLRYRLHL